MVDSKEFERQIDLAWEDYRKLSIRTSVLYFTIKNLSNVEPMYEFSLDWFEGIFRSTVENIPQNNVLKEWL